MSNQKEIYSSKITILKYLGEIYEQLTSISEKYAVKLCFDTLEQATNNKWFDIRKLRLSDSNHIHNINCPKTKSIETLVSEI